MLGYISSRDRSLMRRINGWRPPRWVRVWMLCASRAGDGWLWSGIGLALLLFGGSGRFLALGAAATSAAISASLFLRLKKIARRTRPCSVEPHGWATLLPPDQFSFPSGHSMTAFAVAVPLSLSYPALAPALLFCAVSVALSRFLLGMHFLSDVVAGLALGTVIGASIYGLLQ